MSALDYAAVAEAMFEDTSIVTGVQRLLDRTLRPDERRQFETLIRERFETIAGRPGTPEDAQPLGVKLLSLARKAGAN